LDVPIVLDATSTSKAGIATFLWRRINTVLKKLVFLDFKLKRLLERIPALSLTNKMDVPIYVIRLFVSKADAAFLT